MHVNIYIFYIIIIYKEHNFKIFTVYKTSRHLKKVSPLEKKKLLKTKWLNQIKEF